LEEQKIPHQVVKYLDIDANLSFDQLSEIIKILDMEPIEIVRVKEDLWKNFKGKELTATEIIQILVENPKLIERPIVINGKKGVVARPFDKIKAII